MTAYHVARLRLVATKTHRWRTHIPMWSKPLCNKGLGIWVSNARLLILCRWAGMAYALISFLHLYVRSLVPCNPPVFASPRMPHHRDVQIQLAAYYPFFFLPLIAACHDIQQSRQAIIFSRHCPLRAALCTPIFRSWSTYCNYECWRRKNVFLSNTWWAISQDLKFRRWAPAFQRTYIFHTPTATACWVSQSHPNCFVRRK